MIPMFRPFAATLLLAAGLGASAQAPSPAATAGSNAPIRGVVRAGAEATLTSRLAARIAAMPRQEGESFRKGEMLVQFECDRPQAELRSAQALLQVQRRQLEAQTELEKFGATGKTEVFGPTGMQAKEEWWYPEYMKEKCPGLPNWEALKDPACAE